MWRNASSTAAPKAKQIKDTGAKHADRSLPQLPGPDHEEPPPGVRLHGCGESSISGSWWRILWSLNRGKMREKQKKSRISFSSMFMRPQNHAGKDVMMGLFLCEVHVDTPRAESANEQKAGSLRRNKKSALNLSAEEPQELGNDPGSPVRSGPGRAPVWTTTSSPSVKVLDGREDLVTALLEQLGTKPSKVGFRTFVFLKGHCAR